MKHRPEEIERTGEIPRRPENGWSALATPEMLEELAEHYAASVPLQIDLDDDRPPIAYGRILLVAAALVPAAALAGWAVAELWGPGGAVWHP